jgi:uncharacterized glyoxalase superfamily protein PhnB
VAGFQLRSPRDAVAQWRWATIQAGACELMLAESGGPAQQLAQNQSPDEDSWPVIYYFYPEDVVALHGELRQKNFAVGDLRVTFYGMKEFELRDPNGHILWFGQETDEPPSAGQPGQPQ